MAEGSRTGPEVVIAKTVMKRLLDESSKSLPYECCGILFGTSTRIIAAEPALNLHPKPIDNFEIDPAALIAAHRNERAGGPRIAGYYHSHPNGNPEPSEKDRAMAARDGKIWAIVAGNNVRLWRDDPGNFEPLSYGMVDRL